MALEEAEEAALLVMIGCHELRGERIKAPGERQLRRVGLQKARSDPGLKRL
jgi:hypothetical protein